MIIYHITSKLEWENAQAGENYLSPSLKEEGFIHCCTEKQVAAVSQMYYKGVQGLVILSVDSARLNVECRYEDSHANGELFPHIYGPLPIKAVLKAAPFSPGLNGLAEWSDAA